MTTLFRTLILTLLLHYISGSDKVWRWVTEQEPQTEILPPVPAVLRGSNDLNFTTCFIVPVRHRPEHMFVFTSYMMQLYPDARIIFPEQVDEGIFNKGSLFNVGFLLAEAMGCETIAIHDVDELPNWGTEYKVVDGLPTSMVNAVDRFKWTASYQIFFGIAVSMSIEQYRQINGMSNRFAGWGGEDDELYFRLKHNGLLKTPDRNRPAPDQGIFISLEGGHTVRDKTKYTENLKVLDTSSNDPTYWKTDGLNSLQFSIHRCTMIRQVVQISVQLDGVQGPPPNHATCVDLYNQGQNPKQPLLVDVPLRVQNKTIRPSRV